MQLTQHVLDNDDRTRRAEALLSHFRVWLALIGLIVVAVVWGFHPSEWTPLAYSIGIGGFVLMQIIRRRRRR